jgi:hypothetical protein
LRVEHRPNKCEVVSSNSISTKGRKKKEKYFQFFSRITQVLRKILKYFSPGSLVFSERENRKLVKVEGSLQPVSLVHGRAWMVLVVTDIGV